jgi:hypothetical protein
LVRLSSPVKPSKSFDDGFWLVLLVVGGHFAKFSSPWHVPLQPGLALGQNWGIAAKGLTARTAAPKPSPKVFNVIFIKAPPEKWWIEDVEDVYVCYYIQALLGRQACLSSGRLPLIFLACKL